MQSDVIYEIGSLKIKLNKKIEIFDKNYSHSFEGDYDWYFEIIISNHLISSVLYSAEKDNNKDDIIYINDNCIYEFDIANQKTICYCADIHEVEISLIGAPIQIVALNTNRVCLHGSGIKYKDEIILFSGNSGVGKSTLMNFILDSFDFFCDDMCLFEKINNIGVAHRVESYIKLYKNQLSSTDNYTKASESKYFVPISENANTYNTKRKPYKLKQILFLSRHETDCFTVKKISDVSLKYILCVQSIIFFNENTALITNEKRRQAIELLENVDVSVLYIPSNLQNYNIDSMRNILQGL